MMEEHIDIYHLIFFPNLQKLEYLLTNHNLDELIPNFYSNKKMKKTGLAGIFAASLELTKEGITKVSQKKIFDSIMIKKS